MSDQEFASRLAALDEHHLRFLDELEKSNQRLAESRQQFDHELAERDARWAESNRRFWERLDIYDQRDAAFVRRMEQLREKVDLLSGQSGQIADAHG